MDVDTLELVRPRSVGVEAVGLWAAEQLGLEALLEGLGFNGVQRALALSGIIARMARPGSERATWRWLCGRSALGELLDVDFGRMSAMRLYRISDALLAHRRSIEAHLFDRATDLFGLSHTVTLYDLTNTFFEGEAPAQPKAQRGHSKEKRTDCPLLTLGLVLDGSGFVRRSEVFAGAVGEDTTLAPMLDALHAPADALVVMDAGVATGDNVAWLRDHGYRYLVVSRERTRRFDPDLAIALQTRSRQTVHVHRVDDDEGDETRLYCYSEARAEEGAGDRQAFLGMRLEGELDQTQRGPVAAPHPQGARAGLAADRPHPGERAAAPVRTTPSRSSPTTPAPGPDRSPGNESPWTEPCTPIPASTACAPTSGTGTRRPSGAPIPPSPTWRPCSVPSSPNSACGPSSTRPRSAPTGHLFISVVAYQLVQTIRQATRRAGPERQLGHPPQPARGPAAGHRHLPAQGRAYPACAQGHPCGTAPGGNLPDPWRRSGSRGVRKMVV